MPLVEWSDVIVNVPLTDFISYPSPALSALSDTSSIFEFPSVELEFFNTKAPSVTSVVKRKSPSVPLDMVSPLPKVISLPVTVMSPVAVMLPATVAKLDARVKRSVSLVWPIVAPLIFTLSITA